MELIETCFLASVIYITKVGPWVGVPSISPLMMVSKLWPMQNTMCSKWQCSSGIWNPCRNL